MHLSQFCTQCDYRTDDPRAMSSHQTNTHGAPLGRIGPDPTAVAHETILEMSARLTATLNELDTAQARIAQLEAAESIRLLTIGDLGQTVAILLPWDHIDDTDAAAQMADALRARCATLGVPAPLIIATPNPADLVGLDGDEARAIVDALTERLAQ